MTISSESIKQNPDFLTEEVKRKKGVYVLEVKLLAENLRDSTRILVEEFTDYSTALRKMVEYIEHPIHKYNTTLLNPL